MKNFKLVIEYDGTAYCGWQRQKNDPTIQEAIETAISNMTHQRITLNGSGRTDAGVHAYGQVANFCCETRLTADVFLKGLNGLLPDDIVIRACEPVSETFHARYDAKSKTYRYRILNQAIPAALYRQYAWHIKKTLNMESMQAKEGFSRHPARYTEASLVKKLEEMGIRQTMIRLSVGIEDTSDIIHDLKEGLAAL